MDRLISETSNLTSRGQSIRETVTTTISYMSVIAIPLFVLMVFVGETLVRALYGPAYLAAVPFLVAIAIYRIVQTQREPLDSAVKGMGRPDAVFRISTVTVLVNFVLGVGLVLTVGPIGVVAATLVAETVRCLFLHRTLRANDVKIPIVPEPLQIQLLSATVMAIVVATLTTVLPATLLHQVGVAGTLGVGTYLALVVTQDPRVRRSTVSVGLAVRRLVRSEGG